MNSDFTIKLMGTYEEVQIVTAKIELVWGIENIEEMSGILPSRVDPRSKFNRPYHRYIAIDPHAQITVEDVNGNKVKAKPLTRLFKRKEASNA